MWDNVKCVDRDDGLNIVNIIYWRNAAYSFFSHDSDLTSTNVSLSVCLSVRQSVTDQYVEIAYEQQSVIHDSYPWKSSI